MNRYGRLVLEHNRTHRPDAYSQIPDPDDFFTEAGETIATAISANPEPTRTSRPTGTAATRHGRPPRRSS